MLAQNPKLALKVPLEQRKEVIDAGVYKWTASNYLSTTRLAQAFRTKLGIMIVTSAHARYRDAFVYGLMTFWGADGALFDLDSDQAAAAFALADLVGGGEKQRARPKAAGTTSSEVSLQTSAAESMDTDA